MKLEKITSRQLLTCGTLSALAGLATYLIAMIYFGDLNKLNNLSEGLCVKADKGALATCAMLLAADAAKQSVYVAAIGIILNIAAIYGVYKTFVATKITADVATNALNSDKPYIRIQKVEKKIDRKGAYIVILIKVIWCNIGTRSATYVRFNGTILITDKDGTVDVYKHDNPKQHSYLKRDEIIETIYFEKAWPVNDIENRIKTIHIHDNINYFDIIDESNPIPEKFSTVYELKRANNNTGYKLYERLGHATPLPANPSA